MLELFLPLYLTQGFGGPYSRIWWVITQRQHMILPQGEMILPQGEMRLYPRETWDLTPRHCRTLSLFPLCNKTNIIKYRNICTFIHRCHYSDMYFTGNNHTLMCTYENVTKYKLPLSSLTLPDQYTGDIVW